MLFIFFLEVSKIQWVARFPITLTTPIPTPYLPYLPHTIPTPFLPHTYPIPTHTYQNQPIPTLYQIYFKVRIRQGDFTLIDIPGGNFTRVNMLKYQPM